MKRIALILALTSTSAMAEITSLDVIDSWRTYYAGIGAPVTYTARQGSGKTMQLSNLSVVETIANTTSTSRFDWVKMQQNADGSILITFSPVGEKVDVSHMEFGEEVVTTQFDFSAAEVLATGYPGDIRYSYSAPQITLSEESGNEYYGTLFELNLINVSGEATTITNITESGPRVSDSGEIHFQEVEVTFRELGITSENVALNSTKFQFLVQDASMNFSVEFPLTDIPTAPVALGDFPAHSDMSIEVSSGTLAGVIEQETSLGPRLINIKQKNGQMSAGISQNQIRYGLSAFGTDIGVVNPEPRSSDFGMSIAEFHTDISIPFRKVDDATPFSASIALNGVALSEANWASLDPENSMGKPTADISVSVSGFMRLLVGMFEDSNMMDSVDAPFFVPDLSVDSIHLSMGGATINGSGNLRFNKRRIDPATRLPEAKGTLDFAIIGALGFLDSFGRLNGVDPMAILGAKGGLGMFASPTDAPDSFTSKIEFMSGGGIVVNGQSVR